MKETILLCHKHSAKKRKKRESYATRAAITEKGKKDEIKTEYEKIVLNERNFIKLHSANSVAQFLVHLSV